VNEIILATLIIVPSVGSLLYLFAKRPTTEKAIMLGRRWFAWVVVGSCLAVQPLILFRLDMASAFLAWLALVLLIGPIALVSGWLWGRSKRAGSAKAN